MGAPLAAGTLQADGKTIVGEATYDPEHVASSIVHIASLPTDVQMLQCTLMCAPTSVSQISDADNSRALKMPFVGRG